MVAVPATTRFCWTYVAQMTLLQPSVGSPDFWAGSGFEDKLLQAQGDFSLNAGQHGVTYLPNDEMIAADCPSPPTRWKPRSTSTACTSTSCSAALGCACAPRLRSRAGPTSRPASLYVKLHTIEFGHIEVYELAGDVAVVRPEHLACRHVGDNLALDDALFLALGS